MGKESFSIHGLKLKAGVGIRRKNDSTGNVLHGQRNEISVAAQKVLRIGVEFEEKGAPDRQKQG